MPDDPSAALLKERQLSRPRLSEPVTREMAVAGAGSADPPTSPIPVRDCKSTKYQSKHFPPHACVAAQVAAVLRARAYSPCVAAAEIRATQRLIVADKVVAAQVRAKHVER